MHNSLALYDETKQPLVIDLLGDTSDEEEDVKIFETRKKKAKSSRSGARARDERIMNMEDSAQSKEKIPR